jgi:hypothetical protein
VRQDVKADALLGAHERSRVHRERCPERTFPVVGHPLGTGLPDAPSAYGAMITRPMAAPAQSRYTDRDGKRGMHDGAVDIASGQGPRTARAGAITDLPRTR